MVERWDQGTCTTTCGPGTRELIKETIVVPASGGVCQQESRKETFLEDCENAACPVPSFKGDDGNSKGVLLVTNGDTQIYFEPNERSGKTKKKSNVNLLTFPRSV